MGRGGLFGWLIAGAGLLGGAAAARAVVVRTLAGQVEGVSENGLSVFKGIPFAQAPVGPLRWKAPQAPAAWQGVRKANAFGPACPQPPRRTTRNDGLGAGVSEQSEDCLTLNVWSPSGGGRAPVMVWIHGGAHRFGASSLPFYNGEALARQGAVVVSINYRLGLLGYFAHPALTKEAGAGECSGNFGLLDQIAALTWVRDNIAVFGGDSGNVTVFGESAGGASILYLLASPRAKGLFQKAIVQSGGGWQPAIARAQKEAEGVKAADAMGLSGATATMSELRATSTDALNKAISVAPVLGFGSFADGCSAVGSPADAFASGAAIDVPLIIGANSYEASLLDSVQADPASILQRFDASALAKARAAYGAMDDAQLGRQLFADASFVAPARWIAGRASSGAPAWLYHFSYTIERMRGEAPGARHGAEIPYVFQSWTAMPMIDGLLSNADRTFARTISACWVAFAKSGQPCAGGPHWPKYDAASDQLLEFGPDIGARAGFRKTQLDFHQPRFGARP
jgi:para-nitrobenzyl esterase